MKLSSPFKFTLNVSFLFIFLLAHPFTQSAMGQALTDLIDRARLSGIEQSYIDGLQTRAQARGISESELMAIISPAVSMAENNLPYEMIFEKAFEGISKNISVSGIEPVLGSILENSGRSAEFVDRWVERPEVGQMLSRSGSAMDKGKFRNEMLRVSTHSITQGFDPAIIEEILNSVIDQGLHNNTRPSGILSAINILSDLPMAAQEPAKTASFVLLALKNGFEASHFQNLPSALNVAQRRNQLPASAIFDGLSQQLTGGIPASNIIQNLNNGWITPPVGNISSDIINERGSRGRNNSRN